MPFALPIMCLSDKHILHTPYNILKIIIIYNYFVSLITYSLHMKFKMFVQIHMMILI